jgi:molybdate transport system substrate-binding protein
MMTRRSTKCLLFALFPALLVISPLASAADLMVSAAASLTDALKEAGANYEKQHNQPVHFNFGASSLLARQIEEGGPADLFFSADEASMDKLQQKDLLLPGSRRSLVSNTLVFILPLDSSLKLGEVTDLTNPQWRRIALAQPDSVPAGIYARQYLTSRHLWEALANRVIPTENVRAALAAIESGDADVGVVYKTDALISKKVKVAIEVSPAEGPKISYPIAVLKASKNADEARKFEDYLATPEAHAVFEKFGFVFPR